MKKFAAAAAAMLMVLGGTAFAQTHADREALMKANGQIVGSIRPLVGAFDAAVLKTQSQALVDNATKIKAAFGHNSDKNDPAASPAIWTDAAGFAAAADKFIADSHAVMAATDGPSLQAALTMLQGNCGGCHKQFRVQAAPRPAP